MPWILGAAGVAAGTVLLAGRGRRWWARVVPARCSAPRCVAVLVALLVDRVWRPFPDPLPAVVVLALGGVLAARRADRRRRSRPGAGGPGGCVVALLVVVAGGRQSLNGVYREYPTLRTVLGLARTRPAAVHRRRSAGAAGAGPPRAPGGAGVDAAAGPAGRRGRHRGRRPRPQSGFAARPAMVYLPPAYLTSPRAELPVLVLMAGQPGEPRDWFDGGLLAQRWTPTPRRTPAWPRSSWWWTSS